MSNDDFIKGILALAAWHNGKESLACMAGVACTIRNLATKRYKDDWLQTIRLHLDNEIEKSLESVDVRDPKFQMLLRMVDQVYDGAFKDITCGAVSYVKDTEFTGETAEITVRIGSLCFLKYKDDF